MTLNNLVDKFFDSIAIEMSNHVELNRPEIKMNSFTIELMNLYLNTLNHEYNVEYHESKYAYLFGLRIIEDESIPSLHFKIIKDSIKGNEIINNLKNEI